MNNDVAISVKDVSKIFKLPHEKHNSVKSLFVNSLKRNNRYESQQALKGVSFEVKKGEFFGILGRNGSGKSTLLKMLAGIYVPTTGEIKIEGKLTPFIELGVGFNAELTGRENVFLNGALLGFNKREMDGMYDDIVKFAELERFMDQKLKNYSSGMQVRLAFSIAIRSKSEIMLIDEVLAVGDAAFQRKCFKYFGDLKKNKQTVVFVSHDMESVRKYCDSAILINEGKITESGDTGRVIRAYTELFIEEDKSINNQVKKGKVPLGMAPSGSIDSNILKIDKVWIENAKGKTVKTLDETDDICTINFSVEALSSCKAFVPGVIVANAAGEFITASSTHWTTKPVSIPNLNEGDNATVSVSMPNMYEKGDYKISVNAVSEDLETFYAWKNEAINLYVNKKFHTGAKTNPIYSVKVIR